MGFVDVYFAAPDDASAAAAAQRPGGPLGWPVQTGTIRTGWFRKRPIVEEAGPAYDGFAARNYDGMVNLGTLEELLTGRPYDDLEGDPRWGASLTGDDAFDGAGVHTVTQTLRDALAQADDATLRAVAEPWAETEELAPVDGGAVEPEDVEAHVAFLTQLRNLAISAKDREHQLYWYFEA